MKSNIHSFSNRRQLNGTLHELTHDETTAVSGGLGPIAFGIVFALVRFGFANANHNGSPSQGDTNFEVLLKHGVS